MGYHALQARGARSIASDNVAWHNITWHFKSRIAGLRGGACRNLAAPGLLRHEASKPRQRKRTQVCGFTAASGLDGLSKGKLTGEASLAQEASASACGGKVWCERVTGSAKHPSNQSSQAAKQVEP